MTLGKYKEKKVAILGYGVEGKATYEYLTGHGITPTVLDAKEEGTLVISHPELSSVDLVTGSDYLKKISDFDVVFRSPGIPYLTQEIQKAIKKGVVVTSQTELFFEMCPAPIIGVTGTKGKGTTSTLIAELLRAGGRDVYLGGNIGVPALTFLDKLTKDSVVVLELSSFQLQGLAKSPHIAVLLNVTSEHLDHHLDTAEYREAKQALLRFQGPQDIAIVSGDYDVPLEMAEVSVARKYFFSRFHSVSGCFVDDKDRIVLEYDGEKEVILPDNEVQLRGRHNLENITAAVMAAAICGVPVEVIRDVVRNFRGLEHRLEFVAEKCDVKYYNDSFSTVPETAIAAIKSFEEPIILILGGSSKNSDYTELVKELDSTKNLKSVIYIGDTGVEISEMVKRDFVGKSFLGPDKMTEIVALAKSITEKGDVVLLSPASASFGLFKNYKDRGEQFREAVRSINEGR